MESSNAHEALDSIQSLQQTQPLCILRISEPIAASTHTVPPSPSKRSSDVSADAFDNPSPASLEADLTHYMELFSKLRFSYIEQVTKEKFLRAIVGDPPLVVGHNENVELETQIAELKLDLQARKEEVKNAVAEMEEMGRSLTRRWEGVRLQTTKLETLPFEIEGLEQTIEELKAARAPEDKVSDNPEMNLPLAATADLVRQRQEEMRQLDRQIAALHTALPGKTREANAVERELGILERKKVDTVTAAREAMRRKETGGRDELEEKGRWYTGLEKVMTNMIGVDA